jgi:hypothetical protein
MRRQVFANDGGPLIALDAGDAALWKGGLEPGANSDYGRACDADYPASLIPTTTSSAVVIGAKEGIGAAWWLPSTDVHLFLIGCVFADHGVDEALLRLLYEETTPWTPLGKVAVRSGKVLLFHAACRLSDVEIDPDRNVAHIGHALAASVEPGQYALAACEVSLPDKALFNVVRWTRD